MNAMNALENAAVNILKLHVQAGGSNNPATIEWLTRLVSESDYADMSSEEIEKNNLDGRDWPENQIAHLHLTHEALLNLGNALAIYRSNRSEDNETHLSISIVNFHQDAMQSVYVYYTRMAA